MKKSLPFLFLFLVSIAYFYKFFFLNLIPIPSDIIVGLYHPWIDQKWDNYITNVPVKNPLMSDIVSIIFQWRMEAVDQIKSGHFPFWNPHFFSGLPLFANFQSSLINITNIAFFLPISLAQSWGLMIYLNLLISLLLSYLYFKNLFQNNLSALLASLSYSLSVYSITWLEYGIHTYVASFLPLLLFLIDKYQQSNRKLYLLLLSLTISLQIYGGYPQYSIYSFTFVAIYFFVRYRLKQIFPVIVFALLGLILSLPILLPGYQLTNLSIHSTDLTSKDSFLPIQNIFSFPSPNFWGNPTTRDYYGISLYDNNTIYPSLIALFGIFAFTFSKLSFLNLSIIIFCFIASTSNPISDLLQQYLPLIFPEQGIATKIFVLANFSFAYFAGQILLLPKKNILRGVLITFLWLLILIIYSFLAHQQVSLKNSLYCLLFFIPSALLLLKKHYLILLLMIAELFYYGFKYLPFTPSSYLFPNTPIIDFLKTKSGHYRVATFDTLPQNMCQPYGLNTVDGYDTLAPRTSYQFVDFLNSIKLKDTSSRAILLSNFNQPLINDASIKYILKTSTDQTKLPIDFSPKQYRLAYWNNNVSIIENLEVLPRARFANKITIVNNLEATVKELKNYQTNQAIIIGPTNFTVDPTCVDNDSSVAYISDNPNKIVLNTNSDCSEILVLADTFFPGWMAYVDNQPTTIYQTNINFRSVYIPKGNHQVIFKYNPYVQKNFY